MYFVCSWFLICFFGPLSFLSIFSWMTRTDDDEDIFHRLLPPPRKKQYRESMPPQKNDKKRMVVHQKSTLRLQETVSIPDLELILGKFPPDNNFPSLTLNIKMKLREFNVRKLFSLKQSTHGKTLRLFLNAFSDKEHTWKLQTKPLWWSLFSLLPCFHSWLLDMLFMGSCVFFLVIFTCDFVYLSNSSQSACAFFWACLHSLVFAGGWGRKTSLKYDLMTTITSMTMTMMPFCDLFFRFLDSYIFQAGASRVLFWIGMLGKGALTWLARSFSMTLLSPLGGAVEISVDKWHNGSQICSLSLCSAFLISQECSVDVSKPDLTKKDVKTCCPDFWISKFLNLNFFIKTLDPQNGPSLNCKPVGQVTPDAGDLYGWQHVTSPLDAGILSVCEEKTWPDAR